MIETSALWFQFMFALTIGLANSLLALLLSLFKHRKGRNQEITIDSICFLCHPFRERDESSLNSPTRFLHHMQQQISVLKDRSKKLKSSKLLVE